MYKICELWFLLQSDTNLNYFNNTSYRAISEILNNSSLNNSLIDVIYKIQEVDLCEINQRKCKIYLRNLNLWRTVTSFFLVTLSNADVGL